MYFGGDVYSSVDPFATALGANDDTVTFVGSDEAALALDPEAVDLRGDFIAPGIVHAGLVLGPDSPSGQDLFDSGFTHVHVLGDTARIAAFTATAPPALQIVDYPQLTDLSAVNLPARMSLSAAELVRAEGLPHTAVYVRIGTVEEISAILDLLADDPAVAQRYGYRLLLDCVPDGAQVEALARTGVALTLDPGRGTTTAGTSDHDPAAYSVQPLARLLSLGAQVSFAHSAMSPWAAVRAAVLGIDGTSARAAFNATTRFAHRAAGSPESGTLAPGAGAYFTRWKVERLVVQVADPRVAAWSTDPASGTPGLPELSPDVALPTPVA